MDVYNKMQKINCSIFCWLYWLTQVCIWWSELYNVYILKWGLGNWYLVYYSQVGNQNVDTSKVILTHCFNRYPVTCTSPVFLRALQEYCKQRRSFLRRTLGLMFAWAYDSHKSSIIAYRVVPTTMSSYQFSNYVMYELDKWSTRFYFSNPWTGITVSIARVSGTPERWQMVSTYRWN